MSSADQSEPTDLDNYARAAARLAGLAVDEAWWPAVTRHLSILIEHAAGLERFRPDDEDDEERLATPAPVFQP